MNHRWLARAEYFAGLHVARAMRTRLHGFLLQRVRRRVRVNLRRDAEFGGTPVIPLTKIHNSAVNSMRYGIKRVSRCTVRRPITVSEWTTNDCVTSHVPPFICRKTRFVNPARNVRRILVRRSMPPCRLRRRIMKIWLRSGAFWSISE